MTVRSDDGGIILVNVLVALALGATLVTLMLTSQDAELDRARRMAALTQAEAIALGAEASVVVALRRDMTDGPETDHLAEPWAEGVMQEEVALATGRFSVGLRDVRARLDLNAVASGGLAGQQSLLRLVAVLGLPPETVTTTLATIATRGGLRSLEDVPGLTDAARRALEPHVVFVDTALGIDTGINLNTASPEVMTALIGSAAPASRLLAIRTRAGFLTRGDLTDVGVVSVAGAGFTSDIWDADITVEVDGVQLLLTSRIARLRGIGTMDVIVVSRQFGPVGAD